MAVNPTRMELKKIKVRLKTAQRGHKLLKDKSDEMIRQFTVLIRENYALRTEVESELSGTLAEFMFARSSVGFSRMEEALMLPATKVELKCGTKNIMSVKVPDIEILESKSDDALPYSMFSMTAELDETVVKLRELMVKLIRLAEIEKACNMLADEIEKNKRRVNALEYVMIPEMQTNIKYITMKLDENERGSLVRLMKVKDMINARN